MKYIAIILITMVISVVSIGCKEKTQRAGAIYDEYYLDSLVTEKIDQYKKEKNKATDSLLIIESRKYLDSLKWADSLLKVNKKEEM